MKKSKRAFWIALVATSVFAAGMAWMGKEWTDRRIRSDKVSALLSAPLRSVMEQNDLVLCGILLVKRTGSRGEPWSVRLARMGKNGEIWDYSGYVDRSTVLPGQIMWSAVGTYLVDRNYLLPHDLDLTGIRKGPRFDRVHRDRFWLRKEYLDRFEDYFGSSEVCYLPKSKYHLDETLEEMAEGQGVLLSPEQILTFWDVLCNGGVRPATRYTRRHRILPERTAKWVTDRFRMDMDIPIIGQSGSGTLPFGFVEGIGNVQEYPNPVQSATFVGAFPADNPKYTMCVSLFCNDGTPRDSLSQDLFGELAKLVLENEGLWKR